MSVNFSARPTPKFCLDKIVNFFCKKGVIYRRKDSFFGANLGFYNIKKK